MKLQFPYKKYFFWFGAKGENYKVHFDLGEIQVLKKFNLYANFKSSHEMRVGLVHSGTCNSHLRLEKLGKDRLSITSRADTRRNNNLFAFAGTFDLKNRWLSRFDFLAGRQLKDYDVYFRYLSDQSRSHKDAFKPGKVVLDVIGRRNQYTFGAEFDLNVASSKVNKVQLAASTVFDKKYTVKAAADVFERRLKFCCKGKVNDTFGITFAATLPLDGKLSTKSYPLPFPTGLTLETTV